MNKSIVLILASLVMFGCAELGTSLSQMNEEMGAKCAYYSWVAEQYDKTEGKFKRNFLVPDKYYNEEKNWVDTKGNYYVGLYKFEIYYDVSPYTKERYRFSITCARYY
ncbi:MAG: hypothetical protein ACMZ7B_03275 [Balneola sp.]